MSDFNKPNEANLCELFSKQMEIIKDQLELLKKKSPGLPQENTSIANAPAAGRPKIAVIGMAGRFPGARNVAEFWRNLNAGVESITTFQPHEIDPAVPAAERLHPNYGRSRGVLADVDKFDAEFFRISPREAKLIDPQQRVFLEVAYEALQDAGYDPDQFPGDIGVYGGIGDNFYHIHNVLDKKDLIQKVGSLTTTVGNMKDYAATRVSYKLNLRGPSVSLNTACSTSLVAVDQAVLGLRNFTCDIALAGACSIYVPQKAGFMHGPGLPFASDGHIRPFSSDATGVMFSDGAGLVVLKRLDDAIRDRDHIYGVIIGSAINNDGLDKMSFFAPSASGQTKVIRKALKDAGVSAESLSFIEAHATGTLLGDPVEFEGLKDAFAPFTDKKAFCALGAFKGNIGHTDAAAGVTGLIKALLSLKHKKLPPNINYKSPNPGIDLANSPFYIPTEAVSLTKAEGPLRAGVSAFGFGGTNAHVIIEEAPAPAATSSQKPEHFILLSAETEGALQRNRQNLANHLREHAGLNLADIEYTLAQGRKAFAQRSFVLAKNQAEALEALSREGEVRISRPNPPLVFMFPGQGTQSVNMGRTLYQHEPVFRQAVDTCADLLQPILGLDIRTLMYPSAGQHEQAQERLGQTQYAQPALFIIQYALAQYFLQLGLKPEALVGHSLGEFTCATISGVLELKDALMLVAKRGQLMQTMAPGSMLSVNISESDARKYLDATIDIAAVNGPRQCVLAGSSARLSALRLELEQKGIGCRVLKTSHAFHSPTVDAITDDFLRVFEQVPLKAPRIPYVSTLTADWITAAQAQSPQYWADHMRKAVRFHDSVKKLWSVKPYLMLELGPRDTATVLARKAAVDPMQMKAIPTLAGEDDYQGFLKAIGSLWCEGVSMDWARYFANEKRSRIPLPAYSFEKVSHWLDTIPADDTPVPAPAPMPEPESAPVEAPVPKAVDRQAVTPGLKEQIRKIFADASDMTIAPSHEHLAFLELGFDSLTLTQVSASLKKEFRIDLPSGLLIKQENTLARLAQYVETQLSRPNQASAEGIMPLKAQDQTLSLVSFSQRRMWMHAQVHPQATTYNIPIYFSIKGALNAQAFAESLELVVSRHDILRSSYHFEKDAIYQKVNANVPLAFETIDLSSLPRAEGDHKVMALLEQLGKTPFRLDQPPLILFRLFKMSDAEHIFFLNAHHIVFDLISIQRFLTELGLVYKAMVSGAPVDRTRPALQYADFVAWQQAWVQSGAMAEQVRFWHQHLGAQPLPVLSLPSDKPRPRQQPEVDSQLTLTLAKEPLRRLWELATGQGATPFMLLLASYKYLLMLLSGQREVIVGTTIASRSHPETQDMIGFFANTLALRSSADKDLSFKVFLSQVRDTVMSAFDHQDAPLDEVLRTLGLRRDPARNPLFQTFFSFEKVNRESYDMGSLSMQFMGDVSRAAPATDLNVWVEEHPDHLHITAEYSQQLFDSDTIARFLDVYQNLLMTLASQPESRLSTLQSELASKPTAVAGPAPSTSAGSIEADFLKMVQNLLGLARVEWDKSFPYQGGHSLLAIRLIEQVKDRFGVELELKDVLKAPALRRLLDTIISEQKAPEPAARPGVRGSMHQLVTEAAALHTDKVALRYRNKALTYAELDRHSNRVARYLQKNGVRPGDVVGISMDRSMDLIVGMLGILKAGAAYLPMDPAYPNDRLHYMAENSGLQLILTEEEYAETLTMPQTVKMIAMDEEAEAIMACSDEALTFELPADSLAYVIYTSGSTGKPKGVQIPHGAAVNFLHSMRKAIAFADQDVLMALTTICFDISVLEIFLTLATGATLILMDSESALDGKKLAQTIEEHGVTFFQATPSGWRILTESGWKGSSQLTGLCGGEAFPRDLAEKLIPRLKTTYNVYGPTEATVWATFHKVTAPEDHKYIGRPLENYTILILDEKMQLVPDGEIGDLYIGGLSLALGYMNRPDLTAERFIASPFAEGERIYNTGDRARIVKDGIIEYISRADDQVKIRGYRIELGEIEAVANSHPAVKLSAAVVHEFAQGDQRIVLFVQRRDGQDWNEHELKDFMRKSLPDYFLPNMIKVIDAIPLTHNGKIDRKILRASCAEGLEPAQSKPAAQSTEEFLRNLWKARLKVDEFSKDSNFFDVGGYSLLAIIIAREISEATGQPISLADLLTSTFEQLVYRIDQGRREAQPEAMPLEQRSNQ
ncbi:non-ribosomal peptide synthetase/type I polyketide synthase [Oligoflexus tunisiensis]|uniref:non-ribosomal peptide synthetase/type I polyketide synthase n=1 Tax=Oligoflexus tunisiensis TaxID=708132 RepID=UPI000A675F43|nr:non-ribosomal peptide synthetase/type I polyketide synthase [Oligoflexus tunisiensis]